MKKNKIFYNPTSHECLIFSPKKKSFYEPCQPTE